jgi:hypothetical protein
MDRLITDDTFPTSMYLELTKRGIEMMLAVD